jgi:hypothetical protein
MSWILIHAGRPPCRFALLAPGLFDILQLVINFEEAFRRAFTDKFIAHISELLRASEQNKSISQLKIYAPRARGAGTTAIPVPKINIIADAPGTNGK